MLTRCTCVWQPEPEGLFGIRWVHVLIDPACIGHGDDTPER